MKKFSLLVLVIVFVLMFGGCSYIGNKLISEAYKGVKVQEQLDKINELIDSEEFDQAFDKTKIILDNSNTDEDELNSIVVKFQNNNKTEESLYILNILLLRNDKNDSTLNNLSWVYNMMSKNELSIYYADKALAILPNTEYEYCNKANALRELEKTEDAIKNYDLALELCPDSPTAIWGKAMTYNDMENYEKSLEYFLKYREIDPDDEESTRYYITSCYTELNQTMKAIEEYEKYFGQDATDTSPLYSIAYIYYEQKDYIKSLECYDRIQRIDPSDAWVPYNKVDCYAKMDKMGDAIKSLKKAIELDPECLYEIFYLEEFDKLKKHEEFITIFQ